MGPYSYTIDIQSMSDAFETCNIFYPRALLERLGGFDADAFPGWGGEDTDLGCRALAAGARYRFAPAAEVHHAVTRLGPLATLRAAARWGGTVPLFRRHPELRRHLRFRIFWRDSHYRLTRLALAYALPQRGPAGLVRAWVLGGFPRYAIARALSEDVSPALAPYLLLRDAVEMAAIVRGAVRYRTLLL
jgi:GT2 family glycosyltransferase